MEDENDSQLRPSAASATDTLLTSQTLSKSNSTGSILIATVRLMYLVPLGFVTLEYGARQNKT